jgi:hypothetical protein
MHVTGPYRVTFSSEVWKRIGTIPSDTFQALHAVLEDIAGSMGTELPAGQDAQSELRTTAGGLAITYQRDDATRTVTLLDFHPA